MPFKNAMPWIILQEGSPYIETVNEKLHSLHELGFIDTWINDLVANSSNCDTITKIVGSHGRGLQPLTLEQMQSFFYIVFCGLTLAALGFTIEFAKGVLVKSWWTEKMWAVCGPKINISPTCSPQVPQILSMKCPPQQVPHIFPLNSQYFCQNSSYSQCKNQHFF